jgi:hypothetical protein
MFSPTAADEADTPDKHGGRVERPRQTATAQLNVYANWPGAAVLGRLERMIITVGEPTVVAKYQISSMPRECAGRLHCWVGAEGTGGSGTGCTTPTT